MGSGQIVAAANALNNDIPMVTQLFGNNMPIWLQAMAVMAVVGFLAICIRFILSGSGLWISSKFTK